MKLVQVAAVAVLSAAFLSPAFADQESDTLQREAVQAGGSNQERINYWHTMKSERQTAWRKHCALSASDISVAQKDSAEIKAFCNAIPGR
jgi:hypothetical protein